MLLCGVLVGALRAARVLMEAGWRDADAQETAGDEGSRRPLTAPARAPRRRLAALLPPSRSAAARNAARAALALVTVTLDYALMLISMTFNVGLFLAVVGGLALGVLLFGHVPPAAPAPSDRPRHAAPELAIDGSCCGGTD